MGGEYMDEFYKGYKEITGTASEINDYMENINTQVWYPNEYLIINNTDDGTEREMRWDGEKFVGLRLPPSKIIKAKNALQRCALDMLNNPAITICAVLGIAGGGKTYTIQNMARYAVVEKGWQSKIVGIREYISDSAEIGFLPGTKDAKLEDLFKPLADQLDGGEFELEALKQRGVLETTSPFFIKGRSFNDSILVIEESEDLTQKQIRLIGTRVGKNSRIFFSGDIKQSSINYDSEPGLIKMCNALKGSELFSCIWLIDDVRSETSKLFATLFND